MKTLGWIRNLMAMLATVGVVGLTTYAIFLGCQNRPVQKTAPTSTCPAGYSFDGNRCVQDGQPGQAPGAAPPPSGMELNF